MIEKKMKMDIMQIMDMIPHRYPFLLVDRITECIPGDYVKGYKNLTMNEEFFQGHFPGNPIMPGVLQLEAMAQCSAPLLLTLERFKGKIPLFATIDNVRFRAIVRPGDKFEMDVKLTKLKGPIGKVHAIGMVDGKVVVEADMTVAMK